MGGRAGDAAQEDALDGKTVGGAKNGTYVVHAPHVIQYQRDWQFLLGLEMRNGRALQLLHGKFPHAAKITKIRGLRVSTSLRTANPLALRSGLNETLWADFKFVAFDFVFQK